MKTKLVLWATKPATAVEGDAANAPQKVLLALSLSPEENKVKTRIIEGDDATPELAKALIQNWTKGEEVEFPAAMSVTESELSPKLPLLSEDFVADQPDLLSRMHTEWLFLVLSNKLFQAYLSEIDELHTKVDVLEKYSKSAWDMLKTFWDKVQQQVSEKSIFRGHTDQLRERINVLFSRLKELRAQEDEAAEAAARKGFDAFVGRIADAEQAIEAASNNNETSRIFDTLKNIQHDFQPLRLSKNLRNELWNRIDTAFKTLKEKRNPSGASNNNSNNSSNNNNNNKEQAEERLSRRVEGLQQAIAKMQESVNRDKSDLSAINGRPSNSTGNSQLESQLREVRSKMVQERMDSKQLKLDDMLKTMKELEVQIERIQQREKAAAAKAAAKEVVEVAEVVAVQEITPTEETPSIEETPSTEEKSSTEETPSTEEKSSTEETPESDENTTV
jgi:hypothetical protein